MCVMRHREKFGKIYSKDGELLERKGSTLYLNFKYCTVAGLRIPFGEWD